MVIMLNLVRCTTAKAVGTWPHKKGALPPPGAYVYEGGSRSKFFRNPLEGIT
jgi:hypothetical protein